MLEERYYILLLSRIMFSHKGGSKVLVILYFQANIEILGEGDDSMVGCEGILD